MTYIIVIKFQNGDIKDVGKLTLNQLLELDPISVSMFWEKKFRAFWKEVILPTEGPFGKVDRYMWRREYQARGAPHIHAKLWLQEPMKLETSTEAELLAYITSVVTCTLPDPDQQPELYRLVVKYQLHKCGFSCERTVKHKNRRMVICRYGFPKPIQRYPSLNSLKKVLMSNQKGRARVKLYNLGKFK